jgi:hypothetical protein
MSLKTAKTLSGSIYQYICDTSLEFKNKLSIDKNIPFSFIKIIDFENEDQKDEDFLLEDEKMYGIFINNKYYLHDWIDITKLSLRFLCRNTNPKAMYIIENKLKEEDIKDIDWFNLCSNPNAVHIIEQFYDKIDWDGLCLNPNSIHLIEKELEMHQNSRRINWSNLCLNPNAIHIIENKLKECPNSKRINWSNLCSNPKAIHIIENELLSNPKSKKIDYGILSENPNSIHIIETLNEKLLDKLWHYCPDRQYTSICKNPNAIHIIEKEIYKKNKGKIGYCELNSLCLNPNAIHLIDKLSTSEKKRRIRILCSNPNAIHIIENELNENPNSKKIDWVSLSSNINAISLIKNYINKVNWNALSSNLSIFCDIEYDL